MKPYPRYKPSGIEWIGDIPEHWEVKKLKYVADNHDGKRIPLSSEERSTMQGEFPYYGANGIIDYLNDYIFDGDFLLVGEDGAPFFTPNENVAFIARGRFWPNNHVHILSLKDNNDIGYFHYLMNIVDYKEYISGSTRDKLTKDDLMSIQLIKPNVSEQIAISLYLDNHIERIDDLIEKKQKLIELLKEQRAAIINQAVTKGLNPNVKMRDPGVEWLGEIPEHWEVKKIKHISSVISKGTTPSTLGRSISDAGSVRFLKVENINSNRVSCPPDFFIDEETNDILKRSQLKQYDVLFVIAGATIGKVAVLEGKYLPANTNQAVSFIRLNDIADAEFTCYWLQSSRISQLTWLYAVQAAQPNLSMENLGNFFMPYPTPEEGKAIVSFIKSETAKIDSTITRIEREVGLLQEYRNALISEAVTGKIDVREE